jgi:hypothetical protein
VYSGNVGKLSERESGDGTFVTPAYSFEGGRCRHRAGRARTERRNDTWRDPREKYRLRDRKRFVSGWP